MQLPKTELLNLIKFPAKKAKKAFLVLDEPPDKLTHTHCQPDRHVEAPEKIPSMEGAKIQDRRQLLCMHCKKSRTSFWCRLCAKPLCHHPCFLLHHLQPAGVKTET
jgi:hypothetical protein